MSQQINLFNPIFLKQKKVFGARALVQALGVILLGVVGVTGFAGHRVGELTDQAERGKAALAARQTRLAAVNTQFAPRQRSATLGAELAQAQTEQASLRQVEMVLQGGALGNTSGYAEYFRAFARQNVSGLWLTGLNIAGAGNAIGVQGRAMQPTMIPLYISRLTAEQVMRGKTFASLKIDRPAAAVAATAAAPEAASAPTAAVQPVALSPFVEFSLQSVAAEGGK